MTTRKKPAVKKLRITQVHSQIGNQERIKRVLRGRPRPEAHRLLGGAARQRRTPGA